MAGAPRGNNNAGKGKQWSDELRKELMMTKSMPEIAKQLIAMAKDGDLGAIKEIGDRMDGKSVQSLEVTHNPLHAMTEAELEARARKLADELLGVHRDSGGAEVRKVKKTTH